MVPALGLLPFVNFLDTAFFSGTKERRVLKNYSDQGKPKLMSGLAPSLSAYIIFYKPSFTPLSQTPLSH